MKARTLLVIGFVFAVSCTPDSTLSTFPEDIVFEPSAQMLQAPPGFQVIPEQYIVVLKSGTRARERATFMGVEAGFVPLRTWEHALPGFVAKLSPGALERLRADPRVSYIEPDVMISLDGSQNPVPSWGLDRIDQRTLPLDNTYNYGTTGSGVHAVIIDTGINYDHVDFAGRIGAGYDAWDGDLDPSDCHGHGSHVAGTVGGTSYGVAKEVTLHAVRVFGCSGGSPTSTIVDGIEWVIANATLPAVANMSLGGGISTSLDNAVRNMIGAGIFTAVSAGNDYGTISSCNKSPARVAEAMTVGSTTSSDARSSFSNYGPCVDIFAPGSSIKSAYWTSPTSSATMSGTSMASPHVAGAGALLLERYPGATPAQVMAELLAQATSGVLTGADPNLLLFTGGGNLAPSADFDWGCTGLDCWFDATGSSDPDGNIVRWQWIAFGNTYELGESFNHTFPNPDEFDLTLRVTDDGGLIDEVTHHITVTENQPPTAYFEWSCVGLDCTFDASGSTDDGGIVDYHWWAGSTHIHRADPVLNYTFGGATSFTLNLEVCDAEGECDTTSHQVVVGS